MGKCLASGGYADPTFLRSLVFTPDGKGLLAPWKSAVIQWDVFWLKSTYDSQKDDISTQDLTAGLREISHFVGHEVSRFTRSVLPVARDSHIPTHALGHSTCRLYIS